MIAIQNSAYETTILLRDDYGAPLSGVTAAELGLKYRKMGEADLTVLSPLPADRWADIGDGFYVLKFPASLMDKIGSFFYTLYGSPIAPIYNEIGVLPAPFPAARPGRCVITGTITDLTGEPVVLGARITFRLVDAPYAIDGVFVQGGHYETRADAYGNFSVALVQGVKVVVELELLGIKHVITVPDQETARLIDLLPPLP